MTLIMGMVVQKCSDGVGMMVTIVVEAVIQMLAVLVMMMAVRARTAM